MPLPGFPVSFNCGTDDFITLTLFAPDGVTVLAQDTNSTGVDTGFFTANEIVYTFPDNQTYFIEVEGTGDPLANFTLTISPGGLSFNNPIAAAQPDQWLSLYVPSTQRIFILNGDDVNDIYVTVLDSTNLNIVAQTFIEAGGSFTFTRVCRCLFFNGIDGSVWFFTRDPNTAASGVIRRLDPTSGALIESAAIAGGAAPPDTGIYSPHDNMVYGYPPTFPATSLLVFNCATRLFEPPITIPSSSAPGGFAYDDANQFTYIVIENPSNVFRKLLKLQGGALLSTTAMSDDLDIHSNSFLFHNGLIYGTSGEGSIGHGERALKVCDPATGTVTILANGGQFRIDQIAWDECRQCLALVLSGVIFTNEIQGSLSGARYQTDGTIIEAALLFANNNGGPDIQFWATILWDADTNRIVATGNTKVFTV